MSWSRGLLRLWMVFTVLWICGVGWTAYNHMWGEVVRKADGTLGRWKAVTDPIEAEHVRAYLERRQPDAVLLERLNSWPFYIYNRREFEFFALGMGVPAGLYATGLTLLWIGRGFRSSGQ